MDELDKYGFKATFFCIGDNVRKYQETYQEILKRGHQTGNHTFNHLKGWQTKNQEYFNNINQCSELVNSTLFRPPYGRIKTSQIMALKEKFQLIMWTLLTEDWNQNLDVNNKLGQLKKRSKSGDIIVFHDSDKSFHNLKFLLPKYLEFLNENKFGSQLFR